MEVGGLTSKVRVNLMIMVNMLLIEDGMVKYYG